MTPPPPRSLWCDAASGVRGRGAGGQRSHHDIVAVILNQLANVKQNSLLYARFLERRLVYFSFSLIFFFFNHLIPAIWNLLQLCGRRWDWAIGCAVRTGERLRVRHVGAVDRVEHRRSRAVWLVGWLLPEAWCFYHLA